MSTQTILRSRLKLLAQDQDRNETETKKRRSETNVWSLRLYHQLETNFETFITAYYSFERFPMIFLLNFITTTNIF